MNPKLKNWLKKIGWVGFLFFLFKGLLWIALFIYANYQIWG